MVLFADSVKFASETGDEHLKGVSIVWSVEQVNVYLCDWLATAKNSLTSSFK